MAENMDNESLFVDGESLTHTNHEVGLASMGTEKTDSTPRTASEADDLSQGASSTSEGDSTKVGTTADASDADTGSHALQEDQAMQDALDSEEDGPTKSTESTSNGAASDHPTSGSTAVAPSAFPGMENQIAVSEESIDVQHEPMASGGVNGSCGRVEDIEDESTDSTEDDSYINPQLPQSVRKELRELQRWDDTPYDPLREEADPKWQSCHPKFGQVRKGCAEIVDGLNKLFEETKCDNAQVDRFGKHLKRETRFQPPDPVKIGLKGDSGTGKSSFINSILSKPGLAFTDAGSRACTNNIIEYRYLFKDQKAPYLIRVYFHELKQRRAIIEAHLRDYVNHRQNAFDFESEHHLESLMQSESAVEIFETVFRNHDEFANSNKARNFLNKAEISSDNQQLNQMYDWAEELVSGYDLSNKFLELEADTAIQFAKKIEPFLKTPFAELEGPAQSSPWPFVQVVQVGLNSEVLRHGIIISDVPGVSDTNRTRVTTANRYLRNQDFLLICGNMSRIETNPQTMSQLDQAFQTHGSQKALVATKSDMVGESNDMQGKADRHQSLLDLRTELDSVTSEHKALVEQKKRLKRNTPTDVHVKLGELAEYRDLLEKVEKGRRMKIRNKETIQSLQALYSARTGDRAQLSVHCVTNTEYCRHLQERGDSDFPVPIEYTGIPALRLELKGLTEVAKVEKLRLHSTHTLQKVLTRAEIWSQPKAEERHDGLAGIVAKGIEYCQGTVDLHGTAIETAVDTHLLGVIKESQPDWTAQAVRISSAWTDKNEWKAGTFYAFLRKSGRHKTKVKQFQDWNEQLMKPVNNTLVDAWKKFEKEIGYLSDCCTSDLKALVDDIQNDLEQSHLLPQSNTFYEKLSIERSSLEVILRDERKKFEDECK